MRATDSIFAYIVINFSNKYKYIIYCITQQLSVSLTGTSISSLVGSATTFPSKFSTLASNHFGKVFGFSTKVLNFSVALLFSHTDNYIIN